VFDFDFPSNIWFPKRDAFDFSTAFLFSKISAFDSFSTCLIFKMRSFDFSNDTFDFRNLSRLISQMTLLISEICRVWFIKWHFWFPKFVAFDFSNDTFDFQNETDMDLIHVTVSVGGKLYSRTRVTQSMVTTRPNEAAKVFWWKMGTCRWIGFGFPKGGFVLSVLNRDIYLWRQQSNHIFTGWDKPFGEKGK